MMDCRSPRVSVIDIEKNRSENTPETIDATDKNQLSKTILWKCFQWMTNYLKKFSGLHEKRPNRLSWTEHFWSFFGCLISIILVALLHYHVLEKRELFFLSGAFAASTVIIFCNYRSPVAQPRNLICGHLIGAISGCIMRITLGRVETSTACALAIAIAVVLMQLTETLHPPGGASALLAVTTRPTLPWGHFLFIFVPTLTSACLLLIVALIVNNIPSKRTYPCFWW